MELPPIVVTAPEPFYPGLNQSGGGTMQSPAVIMNQMQLIRNNYYVQGMWRQVIVKLCSEAEFYMNKNGGQFAEWMIGESMRRDLKILPFADNYMCVTGLSPEAALWYAYQNPLLVTQANAVAQSSQVSATDLGPVSALGHFINGDGNSVVMDINKLGLNPSVTSIPLLDQHLASMPIGTSSVLIDKVPYDTFADSFNTGVILGHITLKIEGTATKSENGAVTFNGEARAYNDKYDANQGSFRNALPEAATTILRKIQEVTNAKEYEIEIKGSLPINIQR
ncbi:lipid II-degrading bacteriocin [Pseudomonas sp. SJZ131]|uniref:lipid II-degrading bacteriocin n=1 Tax=Pseudomonas sp. SJZ131 TaxID=2572895 RepID=UPI00119BCA12|nr:lipid II-degrading bacteriocin [Pseudomonas sp. SJZ131]TWD52529.1 colicin M-like protein [Pseudomonas sp. SJZ131]